MEIVSKPDMRSSDEAKAYLTKLRTIVRYLGTCDGNMDEGSMRADVNVSVRQPGRRVRHALRDQERQLDPLRRPGHRIRGAPPDRHPRGRRHDRPGDAAVRPEQGRDALDALQGRGARLPLFPRSGPVAARIRPGLCRRAGGGPAGTAGRQEGAAGRRASACRPTTPRSSSRKRRSPTISRQVAAGRDGKTAANWVINDLLGALNKAGKGIENAPVSPDQLGAIIDLIKEGTISGKIAKDLFEIVWNEGGDPRATGRKPRHEAGHRHRRHRKGGRRDHRRQSRQGRAGAAPSRRMAGWFVGQVMKATGGKANPQAVNDAGQGQARDRGVTRCSCAPPASAILPPCATLLVETWHATYDAIYGAERVTEITDDWHSMRVAEGAAGAAERRIPGRRRRQAASAAWPIAAADAGRQDRSCCTSSMSARHCQGHGIGGMLLDEIIDSFPDAETCRLEVEEANARAVAFYEAYGFSHAGRTANCGGGQVRHSGAGDGAAARRRAAV